MGSYYLFDNFWKDVLDARKSGWAADDGYSALASALSARSYAIRMGEVAFAPFALMFPDKHTADSIKRSVPIWLATLAKILF